MDILNTIFDHLAILADAAFAVAEPYFVEIVIGMIIFTFFFGMISTAR